MVIIVIYACVLVINGVGCGECVRQMGTVHQSGVSTCSIRFFIVVLDLASSSSSASSELSAIVKSRFGGCGGAALLPFFLIFFFFGFAFFSLAVGGCRFTNYHLVQVWSKYVKGNFLEANHFQKIALLHVLWGLDLVSSSASSELCAVDSGSRDGASGLPFFAPFFFFFFFLPRFLTGFLLIVGSGQSSCGKRDCMNTIVR